MTFSCFFFVIFDKNIKKTIIMAWNLFKNKKEETNKLEDNSLEQEVEAALRKAKNDKRDALKEIEKIKSWAAEAIIDTYAEIFPNGNLTYYREQYKKDALEKFEQIQTDNAGKVPEEEAVKCKKIVTAYLNQISLRESKLKLFEKLETEYASTKEKLKEVGKQKNKGDKFLKHSERLNSLDEHTETLSEAMTDTNQLEDIKREFAMKAEYVNQLEKLNQDYSDDVNHDNALAFKDEVDKMLNDLD